MQIKIVVGTDYQDLQNQVNECLGRIKSKEDPKVDVDFKNVAAVVSFSERAADSMCCECRFFDDDGSSDSLIGLCQRCGKRVRFNTKSCENYLDVRG